MRNAEDMEEEEEEEEEESPLVERRHSADSAILLPLLPPNLDKFHCLPTNLCSLPKISLFNPQFGKTIWTRAFVPFKLGEALPTI